jgi:archaellum component FlaC
METTTDGTTQQAQADTNPPAPAGADPSQEVKITKAEWDRVNSLLGRIPDLQGGRDIAKQTREEIAGLKNDIRPLLERAHALGSQNKPLGDALNQIQTEQSEAEFRKAIFELRENMRSGAQPTGAGNSQGVDVAAVLAEYRLDPKDPYVAGKLAGQTFATKEQAELAAARILRDQVSAPQTNSAQQSAQPGSVNLSQESVETQTMRLAELYKNYSQNQAEIEGIEKTLAAAGAIKRR